MRCLLGLLIFATGVDGTRSVKRGVAYALSDADDFTALNPGVGWWYNWHHSSGKPADHGGMEFVPMLWNFNFDKATIEASIQTHGSQYLLVLNEPNLVDQANLVPSAAASQVR